MDKLLIFHCKRSLLSKYILCLFVGLYSVYVKKAKPIEPIYFAATHMTQGKVYRWSELKICVQITLLFVKF